MPLRSPGGGGAPGVRYASDFSGADGGEQIQTALDDLGSTPGTVEVGSDAPQTASDITDASNTYVGQSGNNGILSSSRPVWLVTSSIEIPDNTLLVVKGTIVAQDGLDDNLIRNKGLDPNDQPGSTSNENIHIDGRGIGRLHHNAANSGLPQAQQVQRKMVMFYQCDMHSVRNIRLGPGDSKAVQSEDSDWIYGENIRYMQDCSRDKQDAWTVCGPANYVSFNHERGESGDDVHFLNGRKNEATVAFNDTVGDIKHVHINDTRVLPVQNPITAANQGAVSVALFGSSNGTVVGDVTASNWEYLSTSNNAFNVIGGTSTSTIRDITISDGLTVRPIKVEGRGTTNTFDVYNWTIDSVHLRGSGITLFKQQLSSSTVENLTVTGSSGATSNANGQGMVDLTAGTTKGLQLTDTNVDTRSETVSGDYPLIRVGSSQTVNGITVSDCHYRGNSSGSKNANGVTVQSGATINGAVRFSNLSFEYVTTPYDINQNLGVLIDGHAPTENVGGTPTYTGDGTATQSISLGFRPTYVVIVGSDGTVYDTHDNSEFGDGYLHTDAPGATTITADGFDVGNGTGDQDPNTDTETYDVYYEV